MSKVEGKSGVVGAVGLIHHSKSTKSYDLVMTWMLKMDKKMSLCCKIITHGMIFLIL
jgi:hypothetical protein